jgi:hypothetical protein
MYNNVNTTGAKYMNIAMEFAAQHANKPEFQEDMLHVIVL